LPDSWGVSCSALKGLNRYGFVLSGAILVAREQERHGRHQNLDIL
jgi:hypothetical protein